jgi:Domain of unknown function (DUF4384)
VRARACLLLGLAGACAPAAHAPRPVEGIPLATRGERRGLFLTKPGEAAPPPDWEHVFVSLSVKAYARDGAEYFVAPDAALRTGDRIALQVAVARPAYVFVAQVFPDGHASLLYPQPDQAARLEPGGYHRIPEDLGAFFELDEVTGTEQVALIASEHPLEGDAPELAEALRVVGATGRWPSRPRSSSDAGVSARPTSKPANPDARLPPSPSADLPETSPSTRGVTVPTGSSGRTLDVQGDASHVAAAWFRCQHLPR